jgi:5'-methylthioadenosine phosphorylase
VKPRLGIIGGSGLYKSGLLTSEELREISTPYGEPSAPLEVGLFGGKKVAFLARHGPEHRIPPHMINHRANLWALKEAGVERLVSTSSVGSLRLDIRPGELVVPSDYLCPWDVPTYYDEEVVHVTPELDEALRRVLVRAAQQAGVAVHDGGVYVQTRGPRLETRAEIRLFRSFGDVVGMTMASEATLARELEIPYASICTVDNYCHGIVDEPLTYDEIVRVQRENAEVLRRVLRAFLEAFE